jgi:chitodextrinase
MDRRTKMTQPKPYLRLTFLVALLFALTSLCASSAPLGGSPPKNLRVTGVTDWSVGLSWDAPKGRAPDSYVIQSSTGASMTVPGSQHSATFTNGFSYLRTYTFRAYAVSSGSWSGASNSVTATLLRDTTPPTTPVVSTTETGPTHVDLAWSCFDGDQNLRFDIYVNDQLWQGQVAGTTKRIVFLSPNTAYSFRVKARDSGGNWSQMSEAFIVTTPPADPNDHEAPTMPVGLYGGLVDATEAMVFWSPSTDNVTPQEHIRYYLFVNGTFDGATIYPYRLQFSTYLTPGIVNTIEVFAVDEAGNRSAPATMTIDMRSP